MDSRKTLIEKHFAEVARTYQYLALEHTNSSSIVWGIIEFEAVYNKISIQDSFLVDIYIPPDYNNTPPEIKEAGGRIPGNFHTNPDGFLCLAAPIDIIKKFADNPSLLGFVNDLVIPFLYSFSYWEKNMVMPFGELSHGTKGLLENYLDLFKVDSGTKVLNFLKILLAKNYMRHHVCPCGSGKKICQCHEEILLKLDKCQSKIDFLKDFIDCAEYLLKPGKQLSDRYLIKNRLI